MNKIYVSWKRCVFDLKMELRRRRKKILGMVTVSSCNQNRTLMLNEVIKMSWGKVKLESVITKSGKMDREVVF